ncbi:hypothetical protein B0H14DRAFT_2648307 [Mycena olivaceomarginata]|nr:hypothetical protein B0H14DRAFT_2648307 [Mycena olivaceomarginata]
MVDVVREGMSDRQLPALSFGALEMVTDRREGLAALWTFNQIGHTEDNELRSIAVFMRIENWGRFWYLREQQPQRFKQGWKVSATRVIGASSKVKWPWEQYRS